jgi:polar amino acid transport system permease protein
VSWPAPLDLLPPLLSGVVVTVELTLAALVVATVAAFAAGLMRTSKSASARALAGVYVETFRGTSALVQLYWVYFALPLAGIELGAMTAGILVLGLNTGAYGAEVVRGAVQAVPRAQHDAAIALNMTRGQRLRHVVLPQAMPLIIPSFGNLAVELLKNTSLVSMITLADLTFQAQVLRSATLRSAEIFGLILVIYYLLARVMTALLAGCERRLSVWRESVAAS